LRSLTEGGGWSRPLVLAAALLLLGACANPFVGQGKSPLVTLPTPSSSPTPSPSPTPTTPLAVTAPSFKVGEVGAAYPATAFSASGGVKPYQWTVSGGALPDGLNIGADGSLQGTPTNAGTYKFTVQVADAASSTASASGTILIRPAISASYIPTCATTCNVEQGCVTVCGGFGTVGGGVGPYSYSLISGSPPIGTTLATNALTLKGTFTATGNAQFTAMVTDGFGETASLSPDFVVYQHISLPGGTSCGYPNIIPPGSQPPIPPGDLCYQTLAYTGGVPGTVTLKLDSWAPANCGNGPCAEPAISGTGSSGTLMITIRPVPGAPQDQSGTYTFHIVDQGPCAAGAYCASNTVQLRLSWNG